MFKFLFKDVGLDYRPTFKNIDPLTIGAIITGGASLASSITGAVTQNQQNKAYLQGVRETNAANKELYQMQVRDNRQNWAMENAYNTPVQQLARMRQAGINTPDGSIANGNSMQIQSSSPAAQIAPEQTPNPYGNLNLQGIARDALTTYQSGLQLQDMKMQLYKSGVENQFLMESKLRELRAQELDLAYKGTLNESEQQRLYQLQMSSKYLEDQLENQRSQNYETLINLRKSGKYIDAQTEEALSRTKYQDAVLLPTIKNMDAQSAAAYVNSQANLNISHAQQKQVTNQIISSFRDWRLAKNKDSREKVMTDLAKKYYDMSEAEKRLARALLQKEVNKASEREKSMFARMFRVSLGFELPDLIHGFFQIFK